MCVLLYVRVLFEGLCSSNFRRKSLVGKMGKSSKDKAMKRGAFQIGGLKANLFEVRFDLLLPSS